MKNPRNWLAMKFSGRGDDASPTALTQLQVNEQIKSRTTPSEILNYFTLVNKLTSIAHWILLGCCLWYSGAAAVVESRSYTWADPVTPSTSGPDSREVLSGESTSLEFFQIHTVALPAGKTATQSRILPDTEQLFIVKTGELNITIEGVTSSLGPQSVALILPGDVHQIKNLSREPVVYFEMSYRSKLPMNLERGHNAGGSFVVDFDTLEFKPTDKGGRRNNFRRATAMTNRFEMHMTTLNEGITSHPPHTHTAEEIILMVHGEAEEMINGEPHALAAGDFAFLDSMVPHGIRNTGKGSCTYFAFQW